MFLGMIVASSFSWQVARNTARGDYATVRASHVGNAIVAAVLMVMVLIPLLAVEGLGTDNSNSSVLIMVAVSVLFLAFGEVNQGVLRGSLQFGKLATVRLALPVFVLVIGLSAALIDDKPIYILLGYLVGSVFTVILTTQMIGVRTTFSGPWFDHRTYRESLPLMFGVLGPQLIIFLDVIALRVFGPSFSSEPDALTAVYRVAALIVHVPVFLTVTAVGVSFPIISKVSSIERFAFTRSILNLYLIYVTPVFLLLAFGSSPLIKMIFPDEYNKSADLISILSPGMWLLGFGLIVAWSLQAEKTNRVVNTLGATMAVSLWVLLWVLIPDYGATGVAWVTSGVATVGSLAMLYTYMKSRSNPIDTSVALRVFISLLAPTAILIFGISSPTSISVGLAINAGAGFLYLFGTTVTGLTRIPLDPRRWSNALHATLAPTDASDGQ